MRQLFLPRDSSLSTGDRERAQDDGRGVPHGDPCGRKNTGCTRNIERDRSLGALDPSVRKSKVFME